MKKYLWLAALLCAGALCRWPLTFWHHPYYNSDTAIPDLMARHFAAGEWSVYYWGQAYYGVLDSLILMPLFRLFGQSPQTSQLVPFFGSLLLLLLIYHYLYRIDERRAALVATLLLAVPPVVLIVIPYSTYIYILGPILGMVQLLWWERIKRNFGSTKGWFVGGLIAGFSWYYSHFILVFWIGILLDAWAQAKGNSRHYWVWHDMAFSWKRRTLAFLHLDHSWVPQPWKKFLIFLNALNLGTLGLAGLLWVNGDFNRRTPTLHILVSFSDTAEVALKIYAAIAFIAYGDKIWRRLAEAWGHRSVKPFAMGFFLGCSPMILGMLFLHFPSEPGKPVTLPEFWTNLKVLMTLLLPAYWGGDVHPIYGWIPVLIFTFAFGGLVWRVYRWWRKASAPPPSLVWAGLANLLIGLLGIALWDASQIRYFMIFLLILPVGIAWAIEAAPVRCRWIIGGLLVGLALFSNSRSIERAYRGSKDRHADSSVVDYLEKNGLTLGFADYWLSYKLTAVSGERVIIEPTSGNDRYPPYQRLLREAASPFLLQATPLPPGSACRVKDQDFLVLSAEAIGELYVMRLARIRST